MRRESGSGCALMKIGGCWELIGMGLNLRVATGSGDRGSQEIDLP